MNDNNSILIVPACDRNLGGGHLRRSLYLLRALEEAGRESYLWISENQKEEVFTRFRKFFESSDFSKGFHARLVSSVKELGIKTWYYIILDRFRTPEKEFAFWSGLAPVIGIDEGGSCRSRFDFLIDLLPTLLNHEPNLSAPALLPLPRKRRPPIMKMAKYAKNQPLRILISFGAEDSSGLGISTARMLASQTSLHEITLISPNPGKDSLEVKQKLHGVKVVGLVSNLREHLAAFDLFITHFGIGAFEAVYARVPVLLISPTDYHEKLAKHAGFYSLGIGSEINLEEMQKRKSILNPGFFKDLEIRREKIAQRFGLEGDQEEDLGSLFGDFVPYIPSNCPACEVKLGAGETVIARSPEETYRRCQNCGIIYMSRLKPPPITYDEDYFFEFYKKQYGKTYLEDFPNLMKMARRRLSHILPLCTLRDLRKEDLELKPSVLDIGCAYGPFLAAAADAGFSPYGVDPVEDAVRYVNEELKFTAWQGFFPTGAKAEDGPFDLVTLWYVIEHFQQPGKTLREIHRILREGGVLAFSTPSFSGISGKRRLNAFLKNSPPDHWTVWNPGICKKILQQYGFKLCKIVVTGHHPERFPFFGKFLKASRKGLVYRLIFFISRIFRLGDTFEIYCTKE